ncbi:MAG: TOPRIM nucleotidyl transferase/hydrolase domain-containing protein [Halobacteriota archaeon]
MTTDVKAGFFADTVVLVEGTKDKAAIAGVASTIDVDFQQCGTAVIACDGKDNMPKIIAIFQALRVPVYAIWDNDCGESNVPKNVKLNETLLKLCQKEGDSPNLCQERVEGTFACFNNELHDTLSADLGADVYKTCFNNARKNFGLGQEKGKTHPQVIKKLCTLAEQQDKRASTLISIIERITALQDELVKS